MLRFLAEGRGLNAWDKALASILNISCKECDRRILQSTRDPHRGGACRDEGHVEIAVPACYHEYLYLQNPPD